MESRDAPIGPATLTSQPGSGHAPPGDDARRLTLIMGCCLVILGLSGLLAWLTGRHVINILFPQYVPIAFYASNFFTVAGCIFLWHAKRTWTPLSFAIAMAASALISLLGLLALASYFTGMDLTLESLVVPNARLFNGLPVGHLSPVGAVFFALFAPGLWLALHAGAGVQSRQSASVIGLLIALSGGVMTLGYLMGEPLLYGGNIIPVAAAAALGFVFLGAGLSAAAGEDLTPFHYLTGDSLRAQLLRLFLPLSVGLAILQATAHAAIAANAADPALFTAAWTISFLALTGGVVTYAARALGMEYDHAQAERRKAEELLRQSENRLRFALEGANDGLWDVQMKTGAVYLSPRGCEILGYEPHEMDQVAKVWYQLVHPGDMPETTVQLNAHLEGRSPLFAVEQRLRTKSGEWKWVLARGKLVERDADGAPLRMTGTHTDITDRRRAEDALRWDLALEESLAELYAPLVSASTTGVEMAGAVLEQARKLTGSAHGYVSSIDPVTGESLVHSFTQMKVDGCDVAAAGRSFSLSTNAGDRYPMLWGHALNTREAFFTNAPAAHPAARGLPPGHLPLQQFLSVPVLLGPDLVGQIALANADRDYTERDLQGIRRMGEFYALAIQAQQARQEILALNSQLEQRVLERTQELEASNQELEAFSYSVSHDLRAPLRGVDGWSLALLEDYGDTLDDQAKTYLNRVRSETQRMGQLIDDLLTLSRVTRADMQRQTVNLSALAGRIAQRLQSSQPDRGVEWVIQPGLAAEGNARLLEIALENLLGNAWKFTGKCDQARISFGQVSSNGDAPGQGGEPGGGQGASQTAGQPGRRAAFFVQDNGAGFNMAHAQRLFSPFQRLHKSTEFSGTGIGLATTARIIRRHGGRIWAESTAGQGAAFYFTL